MNSKLKIISQNARRLLIGKALELVSIASDDNLVRLSRILEKLTRDPYHVDILKRFRQAIKGNPGYVQAVRRINNLNPSVKRKLISNLIINSMIISAEKREEIDKLEAWRPPSLLVIDVTDRCNLRCDGCWAGAYHSKEGDISYELLNRIMREAKELGIYFITLAGGEPFIRDDIMRLFREHNDIYFLVYTNGICITKNIAKGIAELGNVAPAISVEGLEKETDARRGNGVHKRILWVMKNLRKEGVLFGFSTMITRHNSENASSDEFIDFYIKQGCCFGWYFQYIPIGRNPNTALMSTPEQRNRLRERTFKIRETKPILVGDFWNDGMLAGGCIAGGRRYIHITNKGDAEPCVFAHFSVDNIKNKSLKQVINSDFFKAIRKAQPYSANKNLLAPCMIIDHPHVLRGICKKYRAKPTQARGESLIEDPKITDFLDNYSKEFKAITGPIWETRHKACCEHWFGKESY